MASSIRKSQRQTRNLGSLWMAIFLFASPALLHADLDAYTTPKIKKNKNTPAVVSPTAMADVANAEVDRGGETTVFLRGIASGGGQIEFRLMQKPRHGRIIRSKQINLETMEVVYRHSGERSANDDSFVFAVRAGGAGPFSPGEARIRIKDTPGRLLAPESLEFPPLLIGKTASDTFILSNDGGAPTSGTIEITSPWQIAEPLKYSLNPGEKQKITVTFAPDRDGVFTGRILFQGSERTTVQLTGQGKAPFSASPQMVKLTPDLAGKRVGSVALTNNSGAPVEVQIATDLKLPKNITLQFGETKEIAIEDTGIGLLNSVITFSSGPFATRIAVSAQESATVPVPALTTVHSPTPTPAITPEVGSQPAPALAALAATPAAETTPEVDPALIAPETFPAKIIPESNDSIRIEWELPKTRPAENYVVQQRLLSFDQANKLKIEWVTIQEAKITIANNRGVAQIGDLDAANSFTFRIAQTGGDPATLLYTRPLTYQTPPGFFHRLRWHWFLYLGGGVLLALVIYQRWREHSEADTYET